MLLTGCGPDETPTRAAAPVESPSLATPAGPPPQATGYPTLEAIAEAIGCTDLEDVGTGGNPGLRAFGVCLLGPHNLDLYLVSDDSWDHLAEQFPAVVGPDWIVVTPTGKDAARAVRRAIGGTVGGP